MFTGRAETDIFVVGGGPAGLAAAIAARRKGFSVMLADGAEPPIDKPCGEGMLPETQEALRALGIEVPEGVGYRFRGIQFVQRGVQVAADFPVGQGLGIRRPLLHELLVQKAEECGVKLLWKTPVSGIEGVGVRLEGGVVPARWIIGADGSRSRVRKWSGLEATALCKQRPATRRHYRVRPWSEYMEIYWSSHAQAYVTPISSEEVCIVVMGESAVDADFERVLGGLPELRARLGRAELGSRERGAITSRHSLRRVSRGRVALMGDASGSADAITGEGLRLTFRQAVALSEALENADLDRYERAHRLLRRRPLWMGNLMLEMARHSGLRGHVLRVLTQKPELFARLLSTHVGQATPGQILMTGAQLGWQLLTT